MLKLMMFGLNTEHNYTPSTVHTFHRIYNTYVHISKPHTCVLLIIIVLFTYNSIPNQDIYHRIYKHMYIVPVGSCPTKCNRVLLPPSRIGRID